MLRYPELDVNVTLVVGDGEALVIDTLATPGQAEELAAAIHSVTKGRLTIANTHHHFDHCFGNATLGAPAWAHEAAVAALRDRGRELQLQWRDEWEGSHPELARGLALARVVPPEHAVTDSASLTIGGRSVMLRYLGPGHTNGDLVIFVPDASVIIAGDLVEESGPPQFEDAYPQRWPETLAALLRLAPDDATIIPGHGAPVGPAFVAAQRADLARVARLIGDGAANHRPAEEVAALVAAARPTAGAATTLDPETAMVAVRRGYVELGSTPVTPGSAP